VLIVMLAVLARNGPGDGLGRVMVDHVNSRGYELIIIM
jgi:hypothetical protein